MNKLASTPIGDRAVVEQQLLELAQKCGLPIFCISKEVSVALHWAGQNYVSVEWLKNLDKHIDHKQYCFVTNFPQ